MNSFKLFQLAKKFKRVLLIKKGRKNSQPFYFFFIYIKATVNTAFNLNYCKIDIFKFLIYFCRNPKEKIISLEKLTALIPAGNEIHNIKEVIASVDFADEILVVIDSNSTDGTHKKALELADRVLERKFDYSSSQKNWAIPQARHEWILLVDADERVTPELKNEVLGILKNPPQDDTVAYWIGRRNHFMGKEIKHSGWKNDKVIRLFKKEECKYNDKRVHEEIITQGKVGKLTHKLIHYTYVSIDRHFEKINRYAWWRAMDYEEKTGKLTAYHFVIKPFWGFFKHYILQSGFKDGVPGLTIAFIRAHSIFTRYIKIWLIRKNLK